MALLTLAVTMAAASSIARTQQWLGPNDACSAEMLLGDWAGLRPGLMERGIGFGLQEQTELWGNLAGGIKQGATYDGLTTASLCIDLAKAARWRGATIFASGFQVYGPGPTGQLVGTLQFVSGLEATPSTKLYDLWFEQQLFDGKASLRFGQEGANDELMLAAYAGVFLNSSFGFPPLLALDLPSGGPNYPLASPFVRLSLRPSSEITFMGAVYTEDPAPPGAGDPQLRDRHGSAFRLNDHALSFAELWYAPSVLASRELPGAYKFGLWVATGPFPDPLRATDGLSKANPASNGIPLMHSGDYGIYWIVNQMLWHKPSTEAQGVGVFLQIMRAPADRNFSDLFIAGGANWKGIIPGRSHDTAGIAFTYAGIGAAARHFSQDVVAYTGLGSPYAQGEMVIETTYRLRLTPWFKLQPDLQYVINPGAGIPTSQSTTPLKNALVVGLRATIDF
jgi:porin